LISLRWFTDVTLKVIPQDFDVYEKCLQLRGRQRDSQNSLGGVAGGE